MKTKTLKPLPLPAKPLKTIKEVSTFVIKLLRLGRCQGPYVKNKDGINFGNARDEEVCEVCLLAAIDRSTANHRLRSRMTTILNNSCPPKYDYASDFNDDPNTTLAQVIELVKRA